MPKLIEMDEKVSLHAQMEQKGGLVILINKFNVAPSEVDQLLWAEDAAFGVHKASTGLHFYSTASRHWRQLRIRQLRGLGKRGVFQERFHASRFSGGHQEISSERSWLPPALPGSSRAGNLCRVVAAMRHGKLPRPDRKGFATGSMRAAE